MPRMTIFKKIMAVTLLLSLLPLLVSSLILLSDLESVNARLSAEIAGTSDIQASESLQMRAQSVAESISDFLHQCENDLQFLSRTSLDQQNLLNFYEIRRGEIWERGPGNVPTGTRRLIPLYRSFAFIGPNGMERLVIRDGRFLAPSELHNVSRPAGTEFKCEDYFNRIRHLKQGEIYVSHLVGFHVSKQEQLAGAASPERASNGASYQGVIRFGSPLFDPSGSFIGMVVISLNHRHLMEFTQHIDPGRNFSTVFPSYQSGNYGFLFDDEGWIITHPKYWDIRGVDRNGRQVPPYTKASSKTDIDNGLIPFNLDQAGFVHPNYPQVAETIRKRKSGYVDITNVGGSKKIMAFAPILYGTGDFSKYGVFGGVTIGFQVDQFHDAARKGSRLINRELMDHRKLSGLIILITAILSGLSAWALSRGITRPLHQLIDGARRLAKEDTRSNVSVSSKDELGELANTFNYMANELKVRKTNLLSTLEQLRHSRLEILDERNFKESILESISSAIVTFSTEGLMTSINATGRLFLGNHISVDTHYREVFHGWGEMADLTEQTLRTRSGYGRQPLHLDRGNGMSHFEIGFFPIGKDAERGLTVTMRNETEKEKLREEMMRLDRLASLGKLSAGIAHEVRNPLTGISLLLDDLHDNATLALDDQTMIKKALTEIERVERLISALLNYSSPPRADFRTGDLNAVVNDTVLLMRRQCERQQVRIVFEAGRLPSFRFDAEKIKQALLNIIRNAVEAMPEGGEISVTTSANEERAIITVRDNGPGIREEDLPLIFEPFFTRKGAGTGLGLSITQRIIEEHHGRIWVDCNEASGTVFHLELPLNMG
ncbi:PAS domain-containing sensor histidine kinase [Geobacter sp. SVR]|uniref:PAS domain-containing sensor histidine kinase n=1 Tax=Geobacter sp. SVR TaxID=2495594 RepID=UPI00143F00E3|nr:PAS domain-containing sensor histidine kinase [Geobacter sp. SVR]BCS54249.1 histidine kinase [Geobacter sp. SVR]GCF85893.1 histidine kinase [Geobacter sp. SVR]